MQQTNSKSKYIIDKHKQHIFAKLTSEKHSATESHTVLFVTHLRSQSLLYSYSFSLAWEKTQTKFDFHIFQKSKKQ